MKQRHAVIVLFALIIASSFTSFDSYRSTRRIVNEDMDRALALALEEQQNDVISQTTGQTNSLTIWASSADNHRKQLKAWMT